MGNKKKRKLIESKLEKNPLTLNGIPLKEAKEIKYLGDYLSNDLSESAHTTVLKRLGLAKHSAYEIQAVIEDSRANKLGGINIGFKIFESSILSFLFHNSETWMDISKKTIVLLDKFFNNFFRMLFRVCTGCPSHNFYWQTGLLRAENIILEKKLLFYHQPAGRVSGKRNP